MTSAVPMFVAKGMAYTSQSRMSADMSGSCGWAVNGSRKKMMMSILLSATRAPICWSPPCGPDWKRWMSSPVASVMREPVVPVANSSCFLRQYS